MWWNENLILIKVKYKVIYFLSVIILVGFAACSPFASIQLSVLEPAEITIPKDIKSVTLAPLIDVEKMPVEEFSELDNLRFNEENYYPLLLETLTGAAETMDNSPKYSRIVIREDIIPQMSDSVITTNEWTDLIRICKEDSTDAIMVMTNPKFTDVIDVAVSDFGFGCEAYYVINSSIAWFVFYPKELKLIDSTTIRDMLDWHRYEITCDYAMSLLPEIPDLIGNACFMAGYKYGKKIAPMWNSKIKRNYYKRGHPKIREGYYYMINDNYIYAAELYRGVSDHKRKKVASRAGFNLALINEMNDNLESAREWAEISNSLIVDPNTEKYIKVLDKRIKDKEKINKQL